MSDYSDAVLADSPVGYWRIGEPSGTNLNDEIGAADGTVVAGTLAATGLVARDSDTAASLDGVSGDLTFPFTIGTGDFSIEFLFQWATGTTLGRDHTAASGTISMLVSGGNILGRIQGTAITPSPSVPAVYAQDGRTHQVVLTRSGTTGTLYIDGVSVGTATVPTTDSTSPWHLGKNGNVGGQFAGCTVDELSFYTTALSGARVLAHFDAGVARTASTTFNPVPLMRGVVV